MTISLRHEIKDEQAVAAMKRLRDLGGDSSPIMRDIAGLLEESTRERFSTQIGPDGEAWEPSLRVKLFGGKTLTQDGHLGDSITSVYDSNSAEVGSNRIYAGIHQAGGFIQSKGGGLFFEFAGRGTGTFVTVQNVFIPARPYLGVNDEDEADINDVVIDHVERRLQ